MSRLFSICEAEIAVFISPQESVMDISWAVTTWRTVIPLELAVRCMIANDNHVLFRSSLPER